MKSTVRICLNALLTLSLTSSTILAFSPNTVILSNTNANVNAKLQQPPQTSTPISPTQLNLFGGLFGGNEKQNTDPSIPKRLFSIPCTQIKSGGLRFALGLFLIGQQGTPVKGSWKANQADDGVLDMFYVDNTAMFSLILDEESKAIHVDRYGLESSLQYQLQESLVLHRLLDEIQTLALEGEEIEDANRLIVFEDPETAVENARKGLPARAEE
eukprot:CAMPEP_0197245800 /NCGR_PEP_ID=MMETSP1429-20130617/10473_1 /TAXON_ID=49237 /ORGANISM="Chaetoceros  sp., Strain UNC1202" /LENGTH=213 /DNA_ID=CAMNT_0042706357 /DNA_START=28 /DNA_END=669 /DNA_ORIENTATION=+